MRSILPRIIAVALAAVLCTAIAGLGEDFLVIKKKGGPTQKVPLNFAPDQIESFQVESAPGVPSGKTAPGTRGGNQHRGPERLKATLRENNSKANLPRLGQGLLQHLL